MFEKESVLQETIIIKIKRTAVKPQNVTITTTQNNADFSQKTVFCVPYDTVVSGEDKYIYLATNAKEVEVLKRLNRLSDTLPSIGLKMKTGLTVDFRNREALRDHAEANAVPLFYSQQRAAKLSFRLAKKANILLLNKMGFCRKIQTIFLSNGLQQRKNIGDCSAVFIWLASTRNMTKLAHRTRLILSAASMNYLSALYMACMCCLIPHRMTVTIEF